MEIYLKFRLNLNGLKICKFEDLYPKDSKKISTISSPYEHAFSLLNISHLQNGVFIQIEKKVVLDSPLHLVFVNLFDIKKAAPGPPTPHRAL